MYARRSVAAQSVCPVRVFKCHMNPPPLLLSTSASPFKWLKNDLVKHGLSDPRWTCRRMRFNPIKVHHLHTCFVDSSCQVAGDLVNHVRCWVRQEGSVQLGQERNRRTGGMGSGLCVVGPSFDSVQTCMR